MAIRPANQRLPGGLVSRGSTSDTRSEPRGGGVKSRDKEDQRAQPNQSLPRGFSSGGQGEYRPARPIESRDNHGVRARADQKLPGDHWDSTNVSQGKSCGATRGADAYQGPRKEESDPTPRKPAQ